MCLCNEEEVGPRGPPAFGRSALERKAPAQLVYTHVCVLYVCIYGWIHGRFCRVTVACNTIALPGPSLSTRQMSTMSTCFQLYTIHAYTQTPLVQPHIHLQEHSYMGEEDDWEQPLYQTDVSSTPHAYTQTPIVQPHIHYPLLLIHPSFTPWSK